MQTVKERLNLLNKACEDALKQHPEVLEGKKIQFSENSGSAWRQGIFSEFENVPDDTVKLYIATMSGDMFRILMSKNMDLYIAVADYIKENVKKKCGSKTLVDYKILGDKILGFTVTF